MALRAKPSSLEHNVPAITRKIDLAVRFATGFGTCSVAQLLPESRILDFFSDALLFCCKYFLRDFWGFCLMILANSRLTAETVVNRTLGNT